MTYTEVKDSGKRQEFSTGSKRDTQEGKGRYDLMSPIVAQRDAIHMENGARKYDARNWEKGQPLSRFLDSAIRHLIKYQEGHRDEDHLAAARWNVGGLMHCEEMIKRGLLPAELNDLPNYLTKPKTVRKYYQLSKGCYPDLVYRCGVGAAAEVLNLNTPTGGWEDSLTFTNADLDTSEFVPAPDHVIEKVKL
jgi:hypothetical protein